MRLRTAVALFVAVIAGLIAALAAHRLTAHGPAHPATQEDSNDPGLTP
jgi:hypothetical protein